MTNTEQFIVVAIAAIIAWDIKFALTKDEKTISQVIRKKATRFPSVPMVAGYLLGHFFGGW